MFKEVHSEIPIVLKEVVPKKFLGLTQAQLKPGSSTDLSQEAYFHQNLADETEERK